MTSPSAVPAGWYADPSGLPALRWWDGREWTSHVQPGAPAVPPTTISAGWRGGPATKPVGDPSPGPHTPVLPTDDMYAPTAPPAAVAEGAAQPAYSPSTAFLTQPVDSVSEQLGYASPAPIPVSPAATRPQKRAVIVGAVSLLINPLLLCSLYAILMGLREIKSSAPGSPERRDGTLAAALGATGILTQAAIAAAVVMLL
ncbi:DUF2510 domain-containing protein [Actinoplanes sp. NPDC051861]|uniref:DUF2510 domain-containing protein n=1 Tax=Actinoplanes sp. NPDC051861 TaxID=3155170 RepID=UPI00344A04F8